MKGTIIKVSGKNLSFQVKNHTVTLPATPDIIDKVISNNMVGYRVEFFTGKGQINALDLVVIR